MRKLIKSMGLFLLFLILIGSSLYFRGQTYQGDDICEIAGPENLVIQAGDSLPDFTENITGTSNIENLRVDAGEVQADIPGMYAVVYSWEDQEGRQYQKIISVTVEGRAKEAVPEKENISSEELKQEMEEEKVALPVETGDKSFVMPLLFLSIVSIVGLIGNITLKRKISACRIPTRNDLV